MRRFLGAMRPCRRRRSHPLDRAAAELRHALTEVGFYTIVNHGVPSAPMHEVYRQVARFHTRPLEEKLRIKLDKQATWLSSPVPSGLLFSARQQRPSADPAVASIKKRIASIKKRSRGA